jgi:hypothetical protein
MTRKQSSSAVSSVASRVLKARAATGETVATGLFNDLLADAKALAGSVLSQDEVKGQMRDEGDIHA